jgi:RNA 3'-terminal phosphate cyclase (ATP)
MRQHLTCVNAAAEVCGAQVLGAELNSQSLAFTPGPVRAGDYVFNIGTAGSCTLVLQTVWPALMMATGPSHLNLSGGTHNPMAPPFHFLARSYAPLLRKLGADVNLVLRRLGFYPAGGGNIEVTIWPAKDKLQPFDLIERGELVEAYAECFAPALPRSVGKRELEQLGAILGWSSEQLREGPCRQNEGPGNALLATLAFDNVSEVFTAFGEKGISAEQVAKHVVRDLRAYELGHGVLGPHLADQWVLPLALAVCHRQVGAAYTATELTDHAKTNFAVIQKFLPVHIQATQTGDGWHVSVTP